MSSQVKNQTDAEWRPQLRCVWHAALLAICLLVSDLAFNATCHAQDLLAEKILRWDFQRRDDQNLDLTPDGWQRIQDRQHPHYIDFKIQPRNPEYGKAAKEAQQTLSRLYHNWETGRIDSRYVAEVIQPEVADFMDTYLLHQCLQVEMDGGACERVSPVFPIDARFTYSLRSEIRVQNLHGHHARVELHLLDDEMKDVKVLSTDRVTGEVDWRRYTTDIASLPAAELKWGRIHVIVEPIPGALHFGGIAAFDTIEVFRLPRLSLTTPLPQHLATIGERFDVICTAMGLRNANSSVKFTLHDSAGKLLKSQSVELESLQFTSPESNDDASGSSRFVRTSQRVYDGTAAWELQLDQPGLYRVRVDLGAQQREARHREILLAVVRDHQNFAAGPFGWSIREFNSVVQPEDLADLVQRFGASRVKIPVWFDQTDESLASRLAKLVDRLQSAGTICIGRLDTPPESYMDGSQESPISLALLRNADTWEPMVAPVLTRLGMKITWFQLGADDDLSLMSHNDIVGLMQDIRTRMQTYSQELKLVLGWTWMTQIPQVASPAWNALHTRQSPQLTAPELEAYLAAREPGQETWINFAPLPASRYSLLDRVRDLTERAIVIKKQEVRAAFLPDPFDSETGIFSADGSVGEMLLPWHTLVSSLGNTAYLGSIQMPNASTNHIFEAGNEGIMVIWNDTPVSEQLYLGDNVTAIDIWGREVPIPTQKSQTWQAMEQHVDAGPWPLILRGVNLQVARWRKQFRVPVTHLASAVGVPQVLPTEFENTLATTAAGKMSLYSPTLSSGRRPETRFEVGTQGKHQRELTIAAKNDASAGKHQLRFDFELNADRPYRFSVYREIALGIGDVEFIWDAVKTTDGRVELNLELLNHTDVPVHFDCKIFPAGRSFERLQVVNALPGSTQRTVPVQAPSTEGGSIWIRCEQIGTGRILNYRVRP